MRLKPLVYKTYVNVREEAVRGATVVGRKKVHGVLHGKATVSGSECLTGTFRTDNPVYLSLFWHIQIHVYLSYRSI